MRKLIGKITLIIILTGGIAMGLFAKKKDFQDVKEFDLAGIDVVEVYLNKEMSVVGLNQVDDKIKTKIYGRSGQDIKIDATKEGKKLVIKTNRKKNKLGEDLKFELLLPEKSDISLQFSSTSGYVHFENIHIDKARIVATSGKITGRNAEMRDIQVETTSGIIEFNDVFGQMDLKTTSGPVRIENLADKKDYPVTVSTRTGGIFAKLREGYLVNAQSTTGKVNISEKYSVENGIQAAFTSKTGKITVH